MADASSSLSVINDVIMTSLLLLKISYTLYVNRLVGLSKNLLFNYKYFSLNVTAMFVKKKTWLLCLWSVSTQRFYSTEQKHGK